MEYLIAHGGGRGKVIVYCLSYQGEGEQRNQFMMGLIDWEKLTYDEKKSGPNGKKSPLSRSQVGGVSPLSRGDKKLVKVNDNNASKVVELDVHQNEQPDTQKMDASYLDIPAFIEN